MNAIVDKSRILSLDMVKGLVMVVMAIDHVRDFFHADSLVFSPTDVDLTTLPIFFTRWVTHYCAPTFSFLAGVSAYLISTRKPVASLSGFLLKRGLWLVLLEVTVINFSWFFDVQFHFLILATIWSLGMSMVVLAGLVWLPQWAILAFSLVVIAGHNLLDGVHFPGSFIWSVLHEGGMYKPFSSHAMLVAYPLLPWVAVMSLGYGMGSLYKATFPADKRRQILSYAGLGCIALFIILTASNAYGNPGPFKIYPTASQTLMSFLNQEKYPPSLRYLLMTLGPAFVLLANTERLGGRFVRFLSTFGRVPFFYYILHLFLIHALAMLAAEVTGYGWHAMVLPGWIEQVDALKGYGFSLGFVYAVWVAVVLMLYPLCRVFEVYKMNNKAKWWLSYL